MTKNMQIGVAVILIAVLATVIFMAQKAIASFLDISAMSLNAAGIETDRSFYMVPAKITGLVGAYNSGTVELYWKPIKKAKLNGYRIYRGNTDGGETIIGSSISSGFVDTTARPGKTYYYRISAVNDLGEGALSNSLRVDTVQ